MSGFSWSSTTILKSETFGTKKKSSLCKYNNYMSLASSIDVFYFVENDQSSNALFIVY